MSFSVCDRVRIVVRHPPPLARGRVQLLPHTRRRIGICEQDRPERDVPRAYRYELERIQTVLNA
ncbi:MAG TPA: hypothetical protein VIU81_11770, partial [Gaiellaceae bacterium]